jgi:hypothetical protein
MSDILCALMMREIIIYNVLAAVVLSRSIQNITFIINSLLMVSRSFMQDHDI